MISNLYTYLYTLLFFDTLTFNFHINLDNEIKRIMRNKISVFLFNNKIVCFYLFTVLKLSFLEEHIVFPIVY